MARFVITALFLVLLPSSFSLGARAAETYKSFNKYARLVPGIDFYSSKRESITPYIKPATQAVEKLKTLLGENLPKGSVFICSTLEQKDSIYEPMVLKLGYQWTLSVESPEIRMEEMMARMKSMMGDDIPAEILDRMKSRQPSMMASAENRMVSETIQNIAYAVIQTTFAENLHYRSSRLNDMGKSPMPDWMDIGIGVYAVGDDPNLAYLLQNMEQTFPIDDVLTMSRPFVASMFLQTGSSERNGGGFMGGGRAGGEGGGFPSGGFGGMSQGGGPPSGFGGGQGFPSGGIPQGGGPPSGFGGGTPGEAGGGSGERGGSQRTIPKDEQDQMIFDGQSSTFFAFLLEKVGIEKVRELIQAVHEGIEGRDFVARPDMLGDDYNTIEEEWMAWVQDLKPQPKFPRGGMPPKKEAN